jgi:hypothetical protein
MLPGVMVDLGWPWWVTSLVAVGVVVVAGAAVFASHNTAVRGVAAVLAVQGVAIAIVAPFVMEDEDDDGVSAMIATEPPAMAGPEGGRFAGEADANCREFGQFAASLGNPTTPAGIARNMDRIMPEFWSRYAAQGRLAPPSGQEAMAARWMTAMARVGSDFEAVRNAARRKDLAAMRAANRRSQVHSKQAARLSSQLGMEVCFQQ